MDRRLFTRCFVLAGCVAFAGRVSAQDVTLSPDAAPAHLSIVDGSAVLSRDGRSEPAAINMPLLQGDRLHTDQGRLEVIFPDGSLLHVDGHTTVDLLSDSLMRLLDGRVILVVSGRPTERPSLDYQIDAPAGSIRIVTPGEYRVTLVSGGGAPDVELAVVRGEALVVNDRGTVGARAGEYVVASDELAPASPRLFNSARLDPFMRWSDDQRAEHFGSASPQYLPEEVQVYAGAFDRYGSWDRVEPYGNVWYPTVQAGWRPYYDGSWRPIGFYGWTWIGSDPWCWPTHHYGRWGVGARGWYWIPGRAWSAAWVSWGVASSLVSWCPLGWDDRPVIGLTTVNSYRMGRFHDPWSAWTVVPRHAFGSMSHVSSVALRGGDLSLASRAAFAVQRAAPLAPAVAASRPFGSRSGGMVATGRAVPRGFAGSPLRASVEATGPIPRGEGVARFRQAPEVSRPEAAGGTRLPYPSNYRSPIPEGFDRRLTAPAATARMRERSAPAGERANPAQGAYEGRQTVPSQIQRMPERSWATPTPREVPAPRAYERRQAVPSQIQRMPERSWATPTPREAPTPRAYEQRQTVPSQIQRMPERSSATPTPREVPAPRAYERRQTVPSQIQRMPGRSLATPAPREAPAPRTYERRQTVPSQIQRMPQRSSPPPPRAAPVPGGAMSRPSGPAMRSPSAGAPAAAPPSRGRAPETARRRR